MVKAVSTPGRLVTQTSPPWARTSCLTMDSPRPLPPVFLLREVSPRQKRSNTRGRSSGRIPAPVSVTRSSTPRGARRAPRVTRPPGGVWRTALDRRLPITWRSRTGSTCTERSPAVCTTSSTSLALAPARCAAADCPIRSSRRTACGLRCSVPASAAASTWRSSMMCWSRWASSCNEARRAASGSAIPSCAASSQPRMLVSGVRNSCAMSLTMARRCSSVRSRRSERSLRAAAR